MTAFLFAKFLQGDYMKRNLKWYDYLTFNINWFAITTRGQVLGLLVPLIVLQFVGEAQKGAYYGKMRLWGLMVALLAQALFGMLSDRNTSRFGRRRPFIVAGTLLEILVFFFIGLTLNLNGITGYIVLFVLYLLSMLVNNMSHAATQGIIPDLVPEEKRGMFSGFKAILELPIPIIFVSLVIGAFVSKGHYIGGLVALSIIMIVCASIAMFIPEDMIEKEDLEPLDWKPFIRLILMSAVFTGLTLGIGQLIQWAVPHYEIQSKVIIGILGVLGMVTASVLGVVISTLISFGDDKHVHTSLVAWIINRLLFFISANNMTSFMTYYFMEKYPTLSSNEAAGLTAKVLPYVAIGMVLAAIPSGYLADRFGKKMLLFITSVIGILGTVILLNTTSVSILYIAGAMIGVAASFFFSVNWALGTTLIPEGKAGTYLGISNLAGAGAGMIGSYLGGPIGDLPQAGFTLLMVIFGCMFFVAMIPLLFIQENHKVA